nr:uncharacterized mitochondrial protein AtMg00810-like [Tanacetum cinerariifolium]GEZ41995.1 uncharacterized mitochondrial protein AtMg00810-like [Tanacetum cinerariifolium]
MAALEDIVYSDDEDNVGVEADFSNLETNISVSPISTTRVYKDHLVSQIIGELTTAPYTSSMARMVKEQNGLTQMNDEDFHTYLPKGKRAICSKWVFRNKKDKRGIVIRNKAQLIAQGHTQEEVIDYEEVFAPVAMIEAIRLFFAYASFMGFVVYVDDIIFGSTNKELCIAFEKLMKDKFQMSSMGELTFFLGLQVKQKDDGIFISQDKYVAEILRKFSLTDGKSGSTPIDTEKPLLKDPDGEDVDVHIYMSMIGSLIYLTSSRPDIMYLKGKPHLGLWYPKDSTFNLVAYFDSDYAGASLDRKSTTGGCQFLGCRLISWQCKKQIVVATSSTEAKYVAVAKLARMGYEKPPPKLTFYKAFFSIQWKFLIHRLVQCVSAKRTAWNEFSCSMASDVICLATCRKFNFSKYIFDSMTCAKLSLKVTHLEQDKISQALEIIKLKQRVKKLEKKRSSKHSGLKRLRKVGTSQRVESFTKTVVGAQKDTSKQGRRIKAIDADEDITLEVNAAEPTVFDDEQVTMSMAQTLIKMKAEKARILDEQMDKRLHDEEMQEKHLDNIKKYQSLKRKLISIAQARKNMIVYLKNMARYKIEHFKGMSYGKVRPIFEREYNKVQTLFIPDKDVAEPTKKRVAKETLLQESFKNVSLKILSRTRKFVH